MRYFLSVEQTDLRARRARWRAQAVAKTAPTQLHLGTSQQPTAPPGGLIAIIDDAGQVECSVPLWGTEGLLLFEGRLLAACPWGIQSLAFDLRDVRPFVSEPWCNYLHSMRPSRAGFIVASTGLDALLELTHRGDVVWQWWATEHGFTESVCGGRRMLDRTAEHRGVKYDTPLHTTHVNSGLELDDSTVLATLFHQGTLVAIDRADGTSTPLLSDLRRPHAVRRCADGSLTVANTGAGQALHFELDARYHAEIVDSVQLDSTWLQDAYLARDRWLLVDGLNARVVHTDRVGNVLQVDQFDRDWRLYEAIPLE
jgi:hypothetical protein